MRRRALLALALASCACARDRRPDLVLISIDTLRADRVSSAREPSARAPTTPRLDAWARAHATVFRQAIAAAPWTLPSHASLLTGLDPLRHATNRPYHALPVDPLTLAERLRASGYATAALVGGGWLDPAYGLNRGFERWQAWPRKSNGAQEWERHAREAAARLDTLPRPFFLFVHTYDVHDFPRAARLPPGTSDAERARLYDDAVRHMDAHLAPLLARLAEPARRARTAVVITSDHGEALGEATAGGGRDYGHGSLRDPVLRVPLIVALPADAALRPARARALVSFVDAQVRAIDVAPTLLELAGATAAGVTGEPALDGASLLPLLRGAHGAPARPALGYFAQAGGGLALRDGVRLKYLFDDTAHAAPDVATRAREALFDLARDPGETHDLAATRGDAVRWRERARRLLARHASGLWLTLRAGDVGVAVELRGALVREGAPTSPHGSVLQRLAGDATQLDIPARQTRRLLFQPAGDLRLELQVARVTTTLDLHDARSPSGVVFDGQAWSAAAGVGAPCSGRLCVSGAWRGVRAPAQRARPALLDPALIERLRALGYLQ